MTAEQPKPTHAFVPLDLFHDMIELLNLCPAQRALDRLAPQLQTIKAGVFTEAPAAVAEKDGEHA
jgi:hypothetical protein